MNYKILLILILFLSSCVNIKPAHKKTDVERFEKFSNRGFALIYDEVLFKKKIISRKINKRELVVFQRNLKKNTSVKITNPLNGKSAIAIVGKSANYPLFNNSVISKRIALEIDLNIHEPYIIIDEIIHNSAFIAKKSKTFEIEKKVANKAPVESITINNLNGAKKIKKNNNKNIIFNYSIKIADFYFIDTANLMLKRIKKESLIKKIDIINISKNQFRVVLGPYLDLKSLQIAYNKLEKFNFENLEIFKND